MPTNYLGSRREWFLPLFGGAEMNRIKQPEITYFTSQMYPYQLLESGTSGATMVNTLWLDPLDTGYSIPSILGGILRSNILEYSMEPDAAQGVPTILHGDLRGNRVDLSLQVESGTSSVGVLDGTNRAALITYSRWDAESVVSTVSILGGTL